MTFMFRGKETNSNIIAVIDCQTVGVAGDILLGALIDAGADVDRIRSAIKNLEQPIGDYSDVKITINQVKRGEFQATQIDITAKALAKISGQQLIEIVEQTSKKVLISEKANQFTSKAIRSLVNAEAELHGNNLADVHLHEVGLIDTPAEIIGVAVALESLGMFEGKIFGTPVAVGGGTIKFSHGIVSCPAPATLAILQSKNYPIKGGPIETELATPTGVAILVNLIDEVSQFYPPMKPLKVGYGAGTKEFPQMPNCLRIVIGESEEGGLIEEEITILETNLDDVTGEVVGYSVDKLLAEGARDVSIIPIFTKKNRPGQILRVVAAKKDTEHLSRIIMEETGTLGVRILTNKRHILNRKLHQMHIFINESKERVNVKVVKDKNGTVLNIKPEFEDLKRIAEKTHKPLREIAQIATEKAREVFLEK